VLAQHVAALPAGWDDGVTRIGSAESLDAIAAALDVSDGAGNASMIILMPPTSLF
jgi:hypothetical protein